MSREPQRRIVSGINALSVPVNKENGSAPVTDQIRDLFKEGKSTAEIVKELGCSEKRVYNTKSYDARKNRMKRQKPRLVKRTVEKEAAAPKKMQSNHYAQIAKRKKIIMDQAMEIAQLRIQLL